MGNCINYTLQNITVNHKVYFKKISKDHGYANSCIYPIGASDQF